jgi:hypothetical protein
VARVATGVAVDASGPMRLLASALLARKLVVFTTDGAPPTLHLIGALTIDGNPTARGERVLRRSQELDGALASLLRELLVTARVILPPPPLYRQPVFWTVLLTSALAVAAAVLIPVELKNHPTVKLDF